MAKQLQLRRGTTAEHSSFTGAVGEVTVDSDKDTLIVHDAYQAGGFPMLREDLSNIGSQTITPAMLGISGGNPYDALMINAAGTAMEFASAAGRLLGVNAYHSGTQGDWNDRPQGGSTHTWTKPAGCNYVLVYCTGGGGGARGNDSAYRGAGGGGGGTCIGWFDVSSNTTVTVTIGGGGGPARNSGRGGTGGNSSFGSYCTAYGGEGGQSDSPHQGGHGGSAVGGFLEIIGGDGEMAHGSDREGAGGSSFWHKAGSDHYSVPSNSNQVRTNGYFGSGGAHGHYSQNNTTYGAGGAGVCVVYAYS